MKLSVSLFLALLSLSLTAADFVNVWVDGSESENVAGNISTKPYPDSRQFPVSWTDSVGTLWLFGGSHNESAIYNDLWSYNATSQKWTMVQPPGTPASYPPSPGGVGYPSARAHAVAWSDNAGNMWMFGGTAAPNSALSVLPLYSDLWHFVSSTKVWTLISGDVTVGGAGIYATVGSAGYPSARVGATGWMDASGNLWLFGGENAQGNSLNDFWKYSFSAQTWTWVGGAEQSGVMMGGGVVGQQGYSGSVIDAGGWTDVTKGKFYLYGGVGINLGYLWRYDVATNTWTLVAASTTGVWGAGSTATPGPRSAFGVTPLLSNLGMNDSVYIFGGIVGSTHSLADIWLFNTTTEAWVLQVGTGDQDTAGTFAELGTATISSRGAYASWIDAKGQWWIFGGTPDTTNTLSDLWKLNSMDPCTLNPGCDTAATCGNNRFVCTCNTGYIGNGYACCNDSITCKGHGTCNATSFTCDCDAKYNSTASPNCDICAGDLYGPNCTTFCRIDLNCSGQGYCNGSGVCVCPANFQGANCSQCAANWYGVNCSKFCNASDTCRGLGSCNTTTGDCICNGNHNGTDCSGCIDNYYGTNCTQFCNANTTCSSNGTCNFYGACQCSGNFAGPTCTNCTSGFFGVGCSQYCDAQGQCNGHGTCDQISGSCVCNSNYTGSTCSQCSFDHFGPTCTNYCDANATCHGHGSCNDPGVCSCNGSFTGQFCTDCAANFYTANCSVYCDNTTCGTHGACSNSTGLCACETGWTGTACDQCAPCYSKSGSSCVLLCKASQTCNPAGQCVKSDASRDAMGLYTGILVVVLCVLFLLTNQ